MSLMLDIFQYKYVIIIALLAVGAVVYILLLNSHTQKKIKKAQQNISQQNNAQQKEQPQEVQLAEELSTQTNNKNFNKGEKGEQFISPNVQFNKKKLDNFKNQRLKSIVEKLKPEVQEKILKS